MTNEIDEVMKRLEEDPSLCTATDIDALIAFYREDRARYEAGVKKPRGGASASINQGRELMKQFGIKLKTTEPMKRRV